jgi:hypothetical protein
MYFVEGMKIHKYERKEEKTLALSENSGVQGARSINGIELRAWVRIKFHRGQ